MTSKVKKRKNKVVASGLQPQYMHMAWEIHRANADSKIYNMQNGFDESNKKIPLEIVLKNHDGDLTLALHAKLIDLVQKYTLSSLVHARSKDGEDLYLHFDAISDTAMYLDDFLYGGNDNLLYTNENGEVTPWIGATNMLEEYQHSFDDHYEVIEHWNHLSCTARIKSFIHQLDFNQLKKGVKIEKAKNATGTTQAVTT